MTVSSPPPADFRIRQVAFASLDIEPVADDFAAVFGLKIAFRDPEIIHYGLKNIILPAGDDFLELVQPVLPDTSAGRYLARRGGDGGYMVIMQAADALSHRHRLVRENIQIVDTMDVADHQCTHIHPRELGGILGSIDSTPGVPNWRESLTHWYPAGGAGWTSARSEEVHGIASVAIQSNDQLDTARRWSRVLDAPFREDPLRIEMLRGADIRFVEAQDRHQRGIAQTALAVDEPELVIERARMRGITVVDGAVVICGSRFLPIRSPVELS